MDTIVIGKIVTVRGLKGELKVYPYTDYKQRYEELDEITVSGRKYNISSVSYAKEMVLLKLNGIDTVESAKTFVGKEISIGREQTRKLDEDEYLIIDLIGCSVYDEQNNLVGKIKDVLTYVSSDIYVISTESGEILIPAVERFIKNIDVKAKRVSIAHVEEFK